MRTICHIYESQNQNYGDIIIGKCMDQLMRKYLSSSKIITVPVSLDYEKPTFRYHADEIAEIANNSDLIMVGGGGILAYIFSNIPVEKFTKPYICYSLGDNSITKKWADSFRGLMDDEQFSIFETRYQKMVNSAKYFSVRADGSKNFMNVPIKESADPATWAGHFFHSSTRPIEESYVLINIAGYDILKRYGKKDNEITEILNYIADYLIDIHLKPIFISHRQRDFFLQRNDVMVINWDEIMRCPERGLAWYEHAKFVIGTRGHSQIISFGYGVPFINIATQAKNIGFMQLNGLENCMIQSQDLSIKTLIEKIEYIIKNHEQLSKEIKEKINYLWQETEKEWKFINHLICPKIIKLAYVIEFSPRDTQWQRAFDEYMKNQSNHQITFGDLILQASYYEVSQSLLNVYPIDDPYWSGIRNADLVFCYTTPFNLSWKWYMLPVIIKSMMKPEAKLIVQFDTDLRWIFDANWRLKYWKEIKHDEVKDIQEPKDFFDKTKILEVGDAYFTVVENPPFKPYTSKPVTYMPLPQSIRVEVYKHLYEYNPNFERSYAITMNHSPEKANSEHTIINVFKPLKMPTLFFTHNRTSFSQLDGLHKAKELGLPAGSEVIGWIPFGKHFLDYLHRGFVAIDDNENYGGWSRFCTECIVAQVPVIGSTLAVKEFFPELYTEPKDYERQKKLIIMLKNSRTFYHRIITSGKQNFLTKLDPITLVHKMLEIGISLGCSYTISEHEFVQQREMFIKFLYDTIKNGKTIPRRPSDNGCTTFDDLTNRSISAEEWDDLYGKYASFMNDQEEFIKCRNEAIKRINPS